MGEQVAGEGAAEGEEKEGREAVRALLLARLDAAGMVRAKGQSAEAHADLRARLVDHLSYMTVPNLMTLAELMMDRATGPGRNLWLAEVVIWAMARDIQPRPAERHRIISSWLSSVRGPEAEAVGELVELYRFLRRVKLPPGPMDQRKIREEAVENNRRREIIRSRIDRGVASAEDTDWMARYAADEREARGLVDAGRAKRGAA